MLEIREVLVYEAVLRVGGETADATEVRYQTVPGKTILGKRTTRSERRVVGPFADTEFTVNGVVSIRTDHKGVAVDSEQRLLLDFDSLGASTGEFRITHGELGEVVLKVSRRIVGRVDPKPGSSVVKMSATDILASMGYNYELIRTSMHDGLSLKVTCANEVRRGSVLVLTLMATNEGERSVSNLLLRTFSRHPWVTGKNLYAGSVAPGCRTEFRRLVKVPLDAQLGDCYLSVGVWDVLGAIPGDAVRIRLKVLAAVDGE
ncbi:MAG: hypothetical protein KAI66_10015 [Lentisphaeria bacterium]|nr:hypothetical protein [Lentisphaeria bacterium]